MKAVWLCKYCMAHPVEDEDEELCRHCLREQDDISAPVDVHLRRPIGMRLAEGFRILQS